jgi:hypothetical protein
VLQAKSLGGLGSFPQRAKSVLPLQKTTNVKLAGTPRFACGTSVTALETAAGFSKNAAICERALREISPAKGNFRRTEICHRMCTRT